MLAAEDVPDGLTVVDRNNTVWYFANVSRNDTPIVIFDEDLVLGERDIVLEPLEQGMHAAFVIRSRSPGRDVYCACLRHVVESVVVVSSCT